MKGFLDLLILARLGRAPSTGYELIRHISREYRVFLSPGSVYSTLYAMERMRLVKEEELGRKRIFCLTFEGQKTLKDFQNNCEEILAFAARFFGKLEVQSMITDQHC